MMHTSESLASEFQRLQDRPSAASAPPVLSFFVAHVSGDAAEYEQRLRSVLSPAVRLGAPRISSRRAFRPTMFRTGSRP